MAEVTEIHSQNSKLHNPGGHRVRNLQYVPGGGAATPLTVPASQLIGSRLKSLIITPFFSDYRISSACLFSSSTLLLGER